MKRLTLLLAIHNHQPDGNFEHVFARAYQDCYQPLVDTLLEFDFVKVALHHTGALYEWIERERSDYFDKLRALVGRGQVEILGGGFYEPMLAVLPERDARGQIELMAEYTSRHFGVRPAGMWLAERVWEPELAKIIADAGVRYTLVDDGHFRYAGLEGRLRGYYVTEKAGAPIAIFPIEQKLRQAIPFLKAWESIEVLEQLAAEEGPGLNPAVTYGDDGEKFGVWPHTKEWVWEKGWMREFLRLLGDKRDHIQTVHFGHYLESEPPTGRVYLPTASYPEMGEWALPADAQPHYLEVLEHLKERGELERARPFLRGGIWQNFLAKYPESNFMHKKMILVSDKLARAQAKLGAGGEKALEPARRELYRAQTNCSYWHGLFGGVYLNYLRDAVYHHLIEAEVQANQVLGAATGPECEVRDLDADLEAEVRLESRELAAYVKPAEGGGVYELDYRPRRFNLLNVLGRRAEGYHQRMLDAQSRPQEREGAPLSIHDLTATKSAGLAELLVYDRHPRFTFIEHFFAPETRLEELAAGRYQEWGDFAGARYRLLECRADGEQAWARLERSGRAYGRELSVEKTLALTGARLGCSYRLRADGPPLQLMFACELNLTLLAGDAPDRYYRVAGVELGDGKKLVSRGETPAGLPLEMVNEWERFVVRVSASPAAPIWRYALETASQSEAGFERTYQGSVLLPLWRALEVGEGRSVEVSTSIEVGAI